MKRKRKYQEKALDAYQNAYGFNNHKINVKIEGKIKFLKNVLSSF
jgi:hypothetical protein